MAIIEKNLKTRIVLTHDEYAALSGKTLKEGEVVLAKVGTTEANGKVSEPIWMMKVGDGDSTVANCPWLVAPAADVYEWAKKSALDAADLPAIPGEKLGITVTVTGTGNAVTDASWDATTKTLTLTKGETFTTKTEFDNHNHRANELENFTDDVTAVVTGLGITTDGIEDLGERLTQAETDIDALQTAVTETLPGQIETKVAQSDYDTKVAALEQADADEKTAREAVAERVTDLENGKLDKTTYETKIGELEQADTDLDTAVKAAQAKADEADSAIKAFMDANAASDGTVDTLKEIIALIESEDAEVSSALLAEINGLKEKFNAEGKALEAVNADTLDGKHADAFATKEQGALADTAVQPDALNDYYTKEDADAAFMDSTETDNAIDAKINALDLGNTYAAKDHDHVVADITDYETDVAAKIAVETEAREGAVEDLQGQIDGVKETAEAALTEVACDEATGLTVETEGTVATIKFIEDVVFVLDGGTAADL